MDLDWTQQSAGAVTLVAARLHNERATDRRVRLANRLDGPVLPPRRNGVPEAGWDRDGVTTVVPAGETVALGYACPAPAPTSSEIGDLRSANESRRLSSTPPVAVEDVGAPDAAADDPDALAAVRELGEHRPPRDVLEGRTDEPFAATASASTPDPDGEPATPEPATELDPSLAAYRTRIETVEALSAAGVQDATDLLETTGGLDALGADLDADARELRALAAAAERLADRAEAATPPTEALRRLS